MKILYFLILIISCGKENIPPLRNQFHNSFRIKNVAPHFFELEEFNRNEGVLIINTDWEHKKSIQYKFESLPNLNNHILKLLTINSKFFIKNNTFDERMKIFIKDSFSLLETVEDEKEYEIEIKFNNIPKKRTSLFFVTSNSERDLGNVDFDFKFNLTGREIKDLVQNKASLAVVETNEIFQELRKNHYRIYSSLADGQVFYVSEDLSFSEFLIYKKINHARHIEDINLLTFEEFKSLEGWWYRKLPGGDYVLFFGDIAKIHESYINKLKKIPFNLSRKDGIASFKNVYADFNSRVLFKLALRKIKRNIQHSSKNVKTFGGNCLWFSNTLKDEREDQINFKDFSTISFNQDIVEQLAVSIPEPGILEMVFQLKSQNQTLRIGLENLNKEITLGYYGFKCSTKQAFPYKISTNKISLEKLFELN